MKRLARLFRPQPIDPLPTGVFHRQMTLGADATPCRLHLRLHPDGSGVLVVNASTVLHLNPTAAICAYGFVQQMSAEEVARLLTARYRVSRQAARADYRRFRERLETLLHTPDLDPVQFLDFERAAPHAEQLTAPLRLDCALTYRLPPGVRPDAAPLRRVTRELSTAEWQRVLDTAWEAGVPHVVFTGGEPTLRPDLPDLIAHAETLGMVTGLLTDGLRLREDAFRRQVLQSGLDHLLLLLTAADDASWEALHALLAEDLFLTVHLTLTDQSLAPMEAILERLAEAGVAHLSLSAAGPMLRPAVRDLADRALDMGFTLHWDLPVPYSAHHPVWLEVREEDVPSGAGRAWLYVEPDGDVLPAQGEAERVLGNLLRDPWERIYPPAD